MPQKIRSACLHDSRTYPIYIRFFPHMNEASNRSRYIRMHVFFFSYLHCHRTDPVCVTYEQKGRNWVTFN